MKLVRKLNPLKFFKLFKTINYRANFRQKKSITILPGIGEKNAINFVKAGFTTPNQILKASDQELLEIPGVGIGFLKRLRSFK